MKYSPAVASKRVVKSALWRISAFMPEPVFVNLLDRLLPYYRGFVRGVVWVRGIGNLLVFDQEGWHRAQMITRVFPYTLVGIGGLESTYDEGRRVNEEGLEGAFVELGVARGGCAALMGMIAFDSGTQARKLWLFDSFEGLPDPTEEDFGGDRHDTGDHLRPLERGSCMGTLEDVQETLFDKFNLPHDSVNFVKGWFQDTVPIQKEKIGHIAVLRLDGDWYESTKICLENLYDQVVPRGSVIIDDYESCIGCRRAVDEFIAARSIQADLKMDGRGGCWFVKPA